MIRRPNRCNELMLCKDHKLKLYLFFYLLRILRNFKKWFLLFFHYILYYLLSKKVANTSVGKRSLEYLETIYNAVKFFTITPVV